MSLSATHIGALGVAQIVTLCLITGPIAIGCRVSASPSGTTTGGGADDPAGTGTQTETMDPGFGGAKVCVGSDDCSEPTGGPATHCVAPYDPGTATHGDAICVTRCVDQDELSRWCVDDGGCCPGLRCSEVDGFCLPLADVGSTGSDTDDTPSGTSGSSSETDDGSGGGTG